MKRSVLMFAALWASPVTAETLPISWGESAEAEEVATLRGLALERFSGSEGRALQAELETQISRIRDGRGEPYYALYALSSPAAADNIEAVIEGGANVSVDYNEGRQKRWYCLSSKEYRTDCDQKDKEEREVVCLTRVVALSSDIRVAHERDGQIIYRRSIPGREELTTCPEDADFPPVDQAITRLVDGAARQHAAALGPRWGRSAYRVLENRKGLTKPQGALFKQALKATKTNANEACRLFDQLALEVPTQRSVQFNAAMCIEMRGDLPGALAAYEAMSGDRDAASAASRVRRTLRAGEIEDARR
ncbi:MAG: hypothetical protein KJZ64_05800 [Sphingomonadaceae bacterium]|nr:hypothetical protein [Sphingomonadaceae bacterium]